MSTARTLHDQDEDLPEIIELSEEETLALFDKEAHELLGMSGDELRRRWLAGEFADRCEDDAVLQLSFFLGPDYDR